MSSERRTPDFLTVGKILQFEGNLASGEPRAMLLDPYYGQEKLIKEAGVSEALEYARTVQPVPGKTSVLLIAVSASEYYGDNRNGDAFPEKPVPGHVEPGEELTRHYQTFEKGNNFVHHVNRDPNKRVGVVIKAFYNWKMHRVELIIQIDNDLGAPIVRRIADGEYPACSMGCRIANDVCSICRNKAPTRLQYCWHLRDYMGQFPPGVGGKKAFAYNPRPNFFDISWVVRPADRTGYMLKKVAAAHAQVPYEVRSSAGLAEYVDSADYKAANLRKLSDLIKMIRGEAVDARPENGLSAQELKSLRDFQTNGMATLLENTPDISDEALAKMAEEYTLPEVVSTLAAHGIVLTTPEFAKLAVCKLAGGYHPEADPYIDSLVANQDQILDILAENPATVDAAIETGLVVPQWDHVNEKLAAETAHWREKRSQVWEYLKPRVIPYIPRHWRPAEAPKLETLFLRDPRTGESLRTTRGMAERELRAQGKAKLLRGLGAAGVLGGIYKLVQHAGLPGKVLAPLLGVGAGLYGAHMGLRSPPKMPTLSGEAIPMGTPLFSKFGQLGRAYPLLPLLSGAGLATLLAQDYRNRGWALQQAQQLANEQGQAMVLPWHEQPRSAFGQLAYEHPVVTGGIGALGTHSLLRSLGDIPGAVRRLAPALIKRGAWEDDSVDGITCPEVNLGVLIDNLAQALESSVQK